MPASSAERPHTVRVEHLLWPRHRHDPRPRFRAPVVRRWASCASGRCGAYRRLPGRRLRRCRAADRNADSQDPGQYGESQDSGQHRDRTPGREAGAQDAPPDPHPLARGRGEQVVEDQRAQVVPARARRPSARSRPDCALRMPSSSLRASRALPKFWSRSIWRTTPAARSSRPAREHGSRRCAAIRLTISTSSSGA